MSRLTLRHVEPPYMGDCVWGVLESIRLGYAAQDVNVQPLGDGLFAAAHSSKLGKGSLDSPWTGLPAGTHLSTISSARWVTLGPPKPGAPQRPALASDIVAAVAGHDFVPCFDLKPGNGTHQTKPYLELKASAVTHQVPIIVMTEQWSHYATKTRAQKNAWEASAKLRMVAAGKVGLPRMLLWREHIPDGSDWWDLLEAVKGAPSSQALPAHVVRVPGSSTADTARKVLAKVTAKADWTPTTPTPAPTPPEVPMTTYSKADNKTQWFANRYASSTMHPNVTVLHTTEGGDWPGYEGGATAPNLTVKADKATKRLKVRGHFPLNGSSRALRNTAGGVETNTLNCIQIELVGTCDPAHKDGYGAIYWPDAPDWALEQLGDLLADLHDLYPAIKLVAGGKVVNGRWPAYPASINANRMTFAQWRGFYGICGHQHVPENVHGDPGALDIGKVLAYAKGGATPTPTPKPAPKPKRGVLVASARALLARATKNASATNKPHVDAAIAELDQIK